MERPQQLRVFWVALLATSIMQATAVSGQIGPDNVDELQLLWDFPLSGGVTANVTLANGLDYVSSWDGSVYALDPETGVEQWSFDPGPTALGIQSTVLALPDGSVVHWPLSVEVDKQGVPRYRAGEPRS